MATAVVNGATAEWLSAAIHFLGDMLGETIGEVDPYLTLNGLRLIHERN